MNKKILAILMALLMVLMGSVALAVSAAPAGSFTITKEYINNGDVDYIPTLGEKLTFTATFDKFVASDVMVNATTQPTYAGEIVAKIGSNKVTIEGTGSFNAPGLYYYTLTENEGNVQGVTYGDEEIKFVLHVGYAEGSNTPALINVGVLKVDNVKNDTITNEYDVGGVQISKTVSGNAANVHDEFVAKVTITAAQGKVLPEEFTVNFTDGITTGRQTAALDEDNSYTFEVRLKHGKKVEINNLPLGAIVTVAENDSKVNGVVNDKPEANAAKYNAAYENNGVAAAGNSPTIAVTNTRNTEIDTGVDTDNMPYIMLMAFVMMLAAAVVLKKRTAND